MVEGWKEDGILFVTPSGANDDWYWLFACLSAGKQGRVVSSDFMRDHHFQMLSNRDFNRWRERHQVFFKLGNWEAGEFSEEEKAVIRRREVILEEPTPYSRRSQFDPDTNTFYFPHKAREDVWLEVKLIS
jgi:proteinaceous RNase P